MNQELTNKFGTNKLLKGNCYDSLIDRPKLWNRILSEKNHK